MQTQVPPRIYCISAAAAPVVAVFHRGPSDRAHVGLWDLVVGAMTLQSHPGVFPKRNAGSRCISFPVFCVAA